MKPILSTVCAFAALGSFLGGALPSAGPAQAPRTSPVSQAPQAAGTAQKGGALRKAPAVAAPAQSSSQELLFARTFDRQAWSELLQVADLEQREHHLDDLLSRARIDPQARLYLEELARAQDGSELAWTARLALRELGRARFAVGGPWSGGLGLGLDGLLGGDPFEEMMRQMLDEGGAGLHLHPPGFGPGTGTSGATGSGATAPSSSTKRVQVQQGADGVRIEISEQIDGKSSTKTYEGPDMQHILSANPELREELGGLELDPGGVGRFSFDLGTPWLERRLERLWGSRGAPDLPPTPLGRTRPLSTDKLGVIVHPLAAERARELGLEEQGLYVERTAPGTYAQLLGVGPGDVLLELNGRPLRELDDIGALMSARSPDEDLTLSWIDQLGQHHRQTWHAQE